jgi:poly(hydroxyalkanoate) granule-associated protein
MIETMHEIWLAGLGALADARKRGPKLLDQLLTEGARVHEETRKVADKALREALEQVQAGVGSRIEEVRATAGDALANLEKLFQSRVHRALGQLGVPTADEIAALSKRVDSLNAGVAALAAKRGARRAAAPRTPRPKGGRESRAA